MHVLAVLADSTGVDEPEDDQQGTDREQGAARQRLARAARKLTGLAAAEPPGEFHGTGGARAPSRTQHDAQQDEGHAYNQMHDPSPGSPLQARKAGAQRHRPTGQTTGAEAVNIGVLGADDQPMPRLIAAVEAELSTDFALLNFRQTRACPPDAIEGASYAASAAGIVQMTTGNKYSDLLLRVERWDARPHAGDEHWEDSDELPWLTVPDGGPASFAIFADEELSAELPLDGLDRARVQVLAAGRHRYHYGESNEGFPRERWLVRLWPDPDGLDAMAGPPRRIAAPARAASTPWQQALAGWDRTGWRSALHNVPAFYEIEGAICRVDRPFAPDELLPMFGPRGKKREEDGPYTWSSSCDWRLQNPDHPEASYAVDRLTRVAEAAGMESLTTFGDMFACLERVGLLVRTHPHLGGRLVPNPVPPPIWAVVRSSQSEQRGWQLQALRADYRDLEDDIGHLLRWADDGVLRTTARTMALRLSRSVEDVLGGLRLLDHLSEGQFLVRSEDPGPDTPLALHADRLTVRA